MTPSTSPRFAHRFRRAWVAPLALAILAGCGDGASPDTSASLGTAAVTTREGPVDPTAKTPDHLEFSAVLNAPFTSGLPSGARDFGIALSYPGGNAGQPMVWQLELLDPQGAVFESWHGEAIYQGRRVDVTVPWSGRSGKQGSLADGIYQARLTARAPFEVVTRFAPADAKARVDYLLAVAGGHAPVVQAWDFKLGQPAEPKMLDFAPLPVGAAGEAQAKAAAATAGLPYTVYYANLHSQTNDSDGGGAIGSCTSSQPAQTGQYGPAAAFSYAKSAGLDVLLTSEHNHYFDGSSNTNGSASPATAKSRYQAGLSAATSFNASNPGFLALYGMEWGVISNGGHLNILNSNELFAWEYNSSNQLLGDRYTAKSDYPAVYATMRQLGLVGQFNHPETSGQFLAGGTALGYNADGDEVMVLAEVFGTSAFSSNTTETESGNSNWENAYKMLLERGFHVAPSSNQDNHCANWGRSYTNRTGVLLPTGTTLTKNSFIDALRARRVFATMDKHSQIVLRANGTRLMGERFSNSGTLSLEVLFSNSQGKTASSVQILRGVPRRNGTVSVASSAATWSSTPAAGEHFFYAKVTQSDGKVLWSAPVWVTQATGGGDTTPPSASASATGSAGTLSFSATASDNVAVTRVDFLVDNVVVGSDSIAPYSLAWDSRSTANGNHTLVARAYDAAGNSGASSAVSFSVNNVGATLNETESNGTIASANAVTTQTTLSGTMGNTSDIDHYKVTLAAGRRVRLDMTGPSGTDYDLYLVNGSGTVLASSEGTTSSETIIYTNGASTATVYVKVIAYSGSSTTQRYNIAISYP